MKAGESVDHRMILMDARFKLKSGFYIDYSIAMD